MLTHTCEIAIRALIYLGIQSEGGHIPPRDIAQKMGCSPTYLAKVMGQLVKAGILRAHRGPQGGMALARPAGDITLLDVVEAVQGLIIANYCQGIGDAMGPVCSFHRAMWEVRNAMMETLRRWKLADFVKTPLPTGELAGNEQCLMKFLDAGSSKPARSAGSGKPAKARLKPKR